MDDKKGNIINEILKASNVSKYISTIKLWSPYAHIVIIAKNNEYAEIIKRDLETNELIEKIKVKSIYVNIWVKIDAIHEISFTRLLEGKTIWVEHTSLTPCYPINIATARSLIIGERIRRCASILGAATSGRFWIEESARQLSAVKLPYQNLTIEQMGKSDHIVGFSFVRNITNSKIAESVFPRGSIIKSSLSESREISFNDIVSVSKSYKETSQKLGARDLNFDFEREVFKFIDSNLEQSQKAKLTKDTNSYLYRSICYYIFLLLHSDRAISVVPLRQIKILEKAKKIALDISNRTEECLNLVYYGDLTFDNQLDAPKKGIFHTVDDMLYTKNFKEYEKAILNSRPQNKLDFLNESNQAFNFDFKKAVYTDKTDNTIRLALMIESLPTLLNQFVNNGNFKNIFRWKMEARERINIGVIDTRALKLAQILIALI